MGHKRRYSIRVELKWILLRTVAAKVLPHSMVCSEVFYVGDAPVKWSECGLRHRRPSTSSTAPAPGTSSPLRILATANAMPTRNLRSAEPLVVSPLSCCHHSSASPGCASMNPAETNVSNTLFEEELYST